MKKAVTREACDSFARRERKTFESLLKTFVDVPTVSAQPERVPDIRRCAELAAKTIRDFGGVPEIIETDGYPMVHGVFDQSPDLPTVTVYNHLDVQPASRETEPWKTDPFAMVIDGDRYLGRGTTDDKGPALSALFGIKASRELGVPVNLRVLWELEEEIGSPNFEKAITKAGDRVRPDSVLVSDTIWVSRKRPALSAGLRGLLGFLLVLETGETDQHSGTTGGAARNPLGELMQLVSEMYDARTGKVKIKGFYDDVAKPSKKELEGFASSGFSVKNFKKDHLFKSIRTEDAMEVMKRIWTMPTMEIHGVVGGYTGPGVKTIIPPRGEVKMSTRLVPNQSPVKLLKLIKAFVKEHNRDVVVHPEGSMYPYQAPQEGPMAEAIQKAIRFGFDRDPVLVREGGSIGAVVSMEKVFRCPVMFLGLSLPEHGYHAPNENFDWQQASGGMAAFVKYFDLIANQE